jgi:aspartate/methionine/tyrosine aminotransferase
MRGAGLLRAVVALAKKHEILVVHDLAYADIVFDGWKAPSIMQVPGAKDVAVEFFTLSKSYNMAGWRIGFMVGNADLVHALARIKSYHDYGSFTPVQVAAIAALEGDQQCVKDIAATYQKRRDVLVKGLREAAGRWKRRRRRCTSGRPSRRTTGPWARWSSPSSCWPRPRSASARASASATMATTTCASR